MLILSVLPDLALLIASSGRSADVRPRIPHRFNEVCNTSIFEFEFPKLAYPASSRASHGLNAKNGHCNRIREDCSGLAAESLPLALGMGMECCMRLPFIKMVHDCNEALKIKRSERDIHPGCRRGLGRLRCLVCRHLTSPLTTWEGPLTSASSWAKQRCDSQPLSCRIRSTCCLLVNGGVPFYLPCMHAI
jgi:hypothetical protein